MASYWYLDHNTKNIAIKQEKSPLDPENFVDFKLKKIVPYNHNTSTCVLSSFYVWFGLYWNLLFVDKQVHFSAAEQWGLFTPSRVLPCRKVIRPRDFERCCRQTYHPPLYSHLSARQKRWACAPGKEIWEWKCFEIHTLVEGEQANINISHCMVPKVVSL